MKPQVGDLGRRWVRPKKMEEAIPENILKKIEDKKDRNVQLQMLALLAFFCNFLFWYDSPKLTAASSLLVGFVFFIYLIYMVNHNILHVLYVFTIYISFQKVLPGDFGGMVPLVNMTNILLTVIIGAWWSRGFLRGETVFKFHAIDFFVIVYTLLLTVALLRGEYIRENGSLISVITYFKRVTEAFFVYFLFVNNIKSRNQIKHIIFCVCVVMAAVGIMGVKQYYMDIGGGSWSNMDKNKITILTEQPNQLASFFCNYSFYILAIALAFWKKWWSLLLLVLFMGCYQSTRVTFSRGGILSFYVAALICLVLTFRMKFIVVAIPLMLVVSIFPEKVLGPRLYKNYVSLTSSNLVNNHHASFAKQSGEPKLDNSAMSRLWIMQAGITRIREDSVSSIFGVGLGLFPYEVIGRHPKVFWVDAHNQWLLILVECGPVALAVFWSILGVCLWKAFYIYFKTKDVLYRAFAVGYISGLSGLFVANFFGSRMNSNEITHFHWILTAVLMRVDFLVRQDVLQNLVKIKQVKRQTLTF